MAIHANVDPVSQWSHSVILDSITNIQTALFIFLPYKLYTLQWILFITSIYKCEMKNKI
jgi:hypothetical protein